MLRSFLLFIQHKILSDLVALNLRCLPPQAKAILSAEQTHWKRFLELKVLGELRLLGTYPPPPFVERKLPPVEMKFHYPDYSSTTGNAADKKALLAAAKSLYDEAKKDHDAQVLASESLNDAFNAAALKQYQTSLLDFTKLRESTLVVLREQHLNEARLAVWLHILPTLGDSFYKIEETVDFAQPAGLVASIELAVFRDRDGEKQQLQLQFWQSTLEVEGKGDPIQFHRYVLLAGRRLALLNNEPVRDGDMKAVFIKGLPDDIFLGFKTGLHNNPASSKTFDDVFQILQVYAGSDFARPKINDLICERGSMSSLHLLEYLLLTQFAKPQLLLQRVRFVSILERESARGVMGANFFTLPPLPWLLRCARIASRRGTTSICVS